jgi:inactivated superfamily I helicase
MARRRPGDGLTLDRSRRCIPSSARNLHEFAHNLVAQGEAAS